QPGGSVTRSPDSQLFELRTGRRGPTTPPGRGQTLRHPPGFGRISFVTARSSDSCSFLFLPRDGGCMTEGSRALERYVKSEPYPWPYNGELRAEYTADGGFVMRRGLLWVWGVVELIGVAVLLLLRASAVALMRCVRGV